MKTEKVLAGVKEVVELLEQSDLRIDEKITICRSAGDMFQQIMTMESSIMVMKAAMENIPKG